jgi:Rab GDP dissociation inhibitor
VDQILYIDTTGEAIGIKSGNEMARAKFVVGDPSYFPKEKVRATGQIVRCICFLNHPIPNCGDSESVQIIIPGPQVNRKNDIFVRSIASMHNVAAKGIYIAIVSTKMEGKEANKEVIPGLTLMGHIMQRFTMGATMYKPVSDGNRDKCYISSSFDATSHFEGDVDNLLSLYKRVTGKDLNININADSVEADY